MSTTETLSTTSRVKFFGDVRWWTIRESSGRWSIATRQEAFKPRGVLRYTIIDTDEQVRGACNLIGYGYGDGTYSDAECHRMLRELLAGDLQISHRNRVRLVITDPADTPPSHPAAPSAAQEPVAGSECRTPSDGLTEANTEVGR